MRKIKVGVMGAYRGSSMINYCAIADNAEVVAICDKWEEGLAVQRELHKDLSITYYNNFEDFIKRKARWYIENRLKYSQETEHIHFTM